MSGTWESPNTEYAGLSVEYADRVINSGKYSLLGRDEFMRYNTFVPESNDETIFAVRRISSEFVDYDHYYGVGGMYASIGGMGWGEMYASAKYIALLDETGRNDWRGGRIVDARAAFIEPQYEVGGVEVFRFIRKAYNASNVQTGFTYMQDTVTVNGSVATCVEGGVTYNLTPVDIDQGIWSIAYSDGETYRGYIDGYIRLNRAFPMFYIVKCSREGEDSHLHSPVIIRLGEVYLNKSEALAKSGDYAGALSALNTIRERSIPGAGYASLTFADAADRIDKERTLELAFQAERSYDVYRNGRSLTRLYSGAHDAMMEVLPTDYRVVYFIPQDAINSYQGVGTLTQNPTSN
jgi:hypothetical protein